MRVPPRWLVACSVAGCLAASSTAVLVLPQRPAEPVGSVELPSFAPGPPVAEPLGSGPAVTGRQIAELAAGPALRRAEELAAAAAPPPPVVRPTEEADDNERGHDRIRKACRDGRMKGRVCKGR